MIWSYSSSKTFQRCQRQWYYKNCIASSRSKDPLRRKVYLLSKLQSISAWRGSIVDLVISKTIIAGVNRKRNVTLAEAKAEANIIFNAQLACAQKHQLHEIDFSPSKLGSNFAALHCMEYGGEIPKDELLLAKAEIETALTNLYKMEALRKRIKSAKYLISQRPLVFKHSDVSIRAVPDLIAFYGDRPPLIIDWKVHAFGLRSAQKQLEVYALALKRCNPHRDFPKHLSKWNETDIEIIEAQLLTNQIREYELSQESIEATESYIAKSAYDISLVIGSGKKSHLEPLDFDTTCSPETCQRCAYKSICWEAC